MATHHDRVTKDPSGGSNTTFGDDREYNTSRQTGTGTGTGALGDDTSYGSSRTTRGTGYGDDQAYGSSRTTGTTGYGDDQAYGSSRTTGATSTGYGNNTSYGSSRTTGATGTGYGDDQAYGSSRTTGTGGLSYNDRGGNDSIRQAGSTTRDYDSTSGSGGYGTTTGNRTDNTADSYGNFRSDAAGRDGHTLLSEYPAREEIPERKSSLSSTPGPFQVPTTEDSKGTSAAVTSSVGSQNAPGKAGEVGESVMAAFGVGGTHVERPKEEQGLGEKIVNLLGG